MKRTYLAGLVILLLVTVQLPYVWLLWLQPKPKPSEPPLVYLKPNLQKSADINWFNPDTVHLRWFWFDNSSSQPVQTVIRSGDNLTLWVRVSEFNRTAFNITRVTGIQIWFFNMWSPNSTQFGTLWKVSLYLQGHFERVQMMGVPNDGTGTQLILHWDGDRIAQPGEILRFDLSFESIVPVGAILVIKSIEMLVMAR